MNEENKVHLTFISIIFTLIIMFGGLYLSNTEKYDYEWFVQPYENYGELRYEYTGIVRDVDLTENWGWANENSLIIYFEDGVIYEIDISYADPIIIGDQYDVYFIVGERGEPLHIKAVGKK